MQIQVQEETSRENMKGSLESEEERRDVPWKGFKKPSAQTGEIVTVGGT